MRQRSSSTASNSSTPQLLHPVLEAALDGLDVELEEELTRYRRQRHRLSRQVGQQQHVQTWQPPKSIGGVKHATPLQLPMENASSSHGLNSHGSSFHESGSSAVASADVKPLAAVGGATVSPSNLDAYAKQATSRQVPLHQAPVGQPIPRQSAVSQDSSAKNRSSRFSTDQSITPDPWLKGDLATASEHYSQAQKLQNQESHHANTEPTSAVVSRLDSLDRRDGLDSDETALMAIGSDGEEDVWLQPNSDLDDENPDGYLESTEELLKSIAEETPAVRSEQNSASLLDSLLTPLGIGSMLLLLLSSATLGFVVMHPSSLDFLTAREQATDEDVAGKASGDPNTPSSSSQIPDSPNLAAEDFVDLNLDTLSTLPESASSGRSPAPSASPSNPSSPSGPLSIAPPSGISAQGFSSQSGTSSQSESSETSSSDPSNIAAAPAVPPTVPVEAAPDPYVPPEPVSPEPYYPPADPYVPPAEAASPPADTAPTDVATAPAASSAPSGNYYYVVTPYNGDPSLESAREAVPDAYVRNFDDGATVQMGAFNDPTKAEELLQQLQEQGIPAEVYHP